jgi:hypothetical protein
MRCFSLMETPRHIDIMNIGRLLRDQQPVDGQLPLRIRLALCHLKRAEEDAAYEEPTTGR